LSYLLNPDQVKRREYVGLGAFIFGAIDLIAGILLLLVGVHAGLWLAILGAVIAAAGTHVLMKIPDLIGSSDEIW
jgi:hypothetical protein